MRHQDLTINHILESFVYANAAARTGATGFVAGDVGRIAFQTDTSQYFRLTSTSPTWQLIAPQTPSGAAYASLQTASPGAAPAATNAVSPGVMMGLGVGHTLTPSASGKVLVMFDGAIANTVASKSSAGQIRYGTGTPPANGAAGTAGTAAGGQFICLGDLANEAAPLCAKALLTGLTLGAAYWFDLQLWTSTGGFAVVTGVTISAMELP